MEDEDLGSQRRKWNETVRAEMLRKMFPNAPKRSKCKLCKTTYPNPILKGSSVATSVCPECVTAIIGTRKIKKEPSKPVEVKSQVIKEEDLMTLKQYLEMEI